MVPGTRCLDSWSAMSRVHALNTFFRLLPVPLYRSSPDGALLAGNEALAALLGYPDAAGMLAESEIVYTYFADPEARNRWVDEIRESGVVYDFDVELLRRDGASIWVRDTARVVRDESGEILYFEGCLIDVTDRIMLQRSKDIFVAMVSHELRNPISVILGLSSELAADYEGFSEDERREMVDLIAREADEASWLIEDLLVVHGTNSDGVSIGIESFDIMREIARVVEVIDADVDIEGEPPIVVQADPGRTRQILRNLLTNAVRYGGDHIRIVVRSNVDSVDIKVSDSGDPIPEAYLDQMFLPFGKVPGAHNSRSVGLGLTVCRRLAEVMNGSLVYSHQDGWSSFLLVLPAV